MKYAFATVFVVLLLAVGWFFVAPMLAASSLETALKNNDTIGINAAVEFPTLRENLRSSIGSAVGQQAGNQDLASQLGAALAGSLLGALLEQLVTPAGLASLYQGGTGSFSGQPNTNLRVSSGLLGIDRFGITLTDPNTQAIP
jgi:hypothetical protein